ncbi:dicarboxylate/amino acid:cation symporter [Robiginitomaculum antarcticum]|uniref:dicarboxylate/amino acid:cation symporter n=1 Tax=Robiginitomaculum antarcticum TaxID=437507 RepID=UPI00036513E3|nr:dicarboxylate/amino acid:cation symporter [Robiginitomaculum antarcticum]
MLKRWQNITLWKRVLIGLALGTIIGLSTHYLGGEAGSNFVTVWIYPFGEAFVRLIKMLILPLIFTTLVVGVIAMGDPKRLGSLGVKTIALYLFTTFIAVFLGLVSGTIFKPGVGIDLSNVDPGIRENLAKTATQDTPTISESLLAVIPENPVAAMASNDIIPVIFFAIIIGVGIISIGDKGKPLVIFFESAEKVVMKITLFVMELAPFGVFALITWVMADVGLSIISAMGKLALALYVACFIQIFVVYGGLFVRTILKLPLVRFFYGVLDAQGVAFSTSSSSATLPVTISCAKDNLGVDDTIAGSVLPLGATINMDGTAIYLGIIALFAAQALGIELTLMEYILVAITVTLTSIGTASVPSASLFLAFAVLSVFGVTLEQYTLIIAFIFPFDRLLDMMRTVTNVTGDITVACTVAKWEGQLDEEVFRAKPVH